MTSPWSEESPALMYAATAAPTSPAASCAFASWLHTSGVSTRCAYSKPRSMDSRHSSNTFIASRCRSNFLKMANASSYSSFPTAISPTSGPLNASSRLM